MRSNSPSVCFTRVVIDGHEGIEAAELHAVMERIRSAVQYAVPRSHEPYVGAALLNLAVCRLLGDGGTQETATTLIRLVDSVLETDDFPRASAQPASAPQR